ncbi:hypothetical protein [Oceanicola sp. S124]|uniref:hypothetical protein n=1 Tax=Oceanicola sp. S124 TaxID=1042378 RepID=UPI0002557940|nr:hypothetical protein [Oceanicola sp. S124]
MSSHQLGPTILVVAAIIALALGLYAYFAPLTGVTGVWGPLVASFGALCLAIGGALLMGTRARGLLLALVALGLVLTAFATALLHQWLMLAALAVCAIGWLLSFRAPKGANA